MTNPLKWIDSLLKTKEDMQRFVLAAFILFILFVKCYMFLTEPKAVTRQVANISVAKK